MGYPRECRVNHNAKVFVKRHNVNWIWKVGMDEGCELWLGREEHDLCF